MVSGSGKQCKQSFVRCGEEASHGQDEMPWHCCHSAMAVAPAPLRQTSLDGGMPMGRLLHHCHRRLHPHRIKLPDNISILTFPGTLESWVFLQKGPV